ncbi:hypothetical protein [Haloplanus pelagicus]|jgi:hypothetical protein|uniref:hypothetical protein n=1 Tax=Haloplanus pelagicus TaxID=2949995 RepID=UPI00203B1B1B|nr:hypothetical protein [Haloplanus sp. HW8-1]
MTSAPGPAFRDHLETLDRETFAAFVAAVYEARGWTVERTDDGLAATQPRGERARRLVIRDAGDDTAEDATVVDAASLHRMVAYALGPDERARLCREFLDREPGSFEGVAIGGATDGERGRNGDGDGDGESGGGAPDAGGGDGPTAGRERAAQGHDAGRAVDDGDARGGSETAAGDGAARTGGQGDATDDGRPDRRAWLGRATLLGIVLSLAVGGAVTAIGGGGVGAAATAVLDGGGDGNVTRAENGTVWPRGVNSTGVTDASALADAHEAALSNRSYRLRLTYREFDDGKLRGVAYERAAVASRDRYRSRVGRLGTVEHDALVIARGPRYANGTRAYVRTESGVRSHTDVRSPVASSPADADGFVDRTEQIVRWYLSTKDSRIVKRVERNGTTFYRIAFRGDPWPASRNVTGWARVDENGVVHELHREYTPSSSPTVRIEVTLRISPGPVTVTRPAWAPPESTNATAATAERDGRRRVAAG